MTQIDGNATVGQLATDQPLATRVFARHKIDFCCGGGKTLERVCKSKGLDLPTVIDEIGDAVAEANDPGPSWKERPLDELIDHILDVYHRPLKEDLPQLRAMLVKVHRVHYQRAPKILDELLQVFVGLQQELEQHMVKEERILFPMIKNGQGAQASGPVSVMEHEHDNAGAALRRIRELTNDHTPPLDACNTWRALWLRLGALESDLHHHIHLENNILFPRALGKVV